MGFFGGKAQVFRLKVRKWDEMKFYEFYENSTSAIFQDLEKNFMKLYVEDFLLRFLYQMWAQNGTKMSFLNVFLNFRQWRTLGSLTIFGN